MAAKGQAHLNKRVPGKTIENPREPAKDGHMCRVQCIKSMWATAKAGQSLKQFANKLAAAGDETAKRWLHNKRVSTKKNQLGIGCTRKKKSKGGGGAPKPSGK